MEFRKFTALTANAADAENASRRPNVLLMIADDVSWKDWGVYGNKFAKTPHIDKAAKEGVRFSNACCDSPVCHSSRSALLTGQNIWRLRDAAVFTAGRSEVRTGGSGPYDSVQR
jgi:arylsulfatase A-like enzyme